MPTVEYNGQRYEFPDGTSDAEIFGFLESSQPAKPKQADLGVSPVGAAAAAGRIALPIVQRAAEEVATRPNLVTEAKTAGKVLGALKGTLAGGPAGGYIGYKAGGKTGEMLAKGAAKVAPSIVRGLETVAPYVGPVAEIATAAEAFPYAVKASPGNEIGSVMAGKYGYTPPIAGNDPSLYELIMQLFSRKQ